MCGARSPQSRMTDEERCSNAFDDEAHGHREVEKQEPSSGHLNHLCGARSDSCLVVLMLIIVAFWRLQYPWVQTQAYPHRYQETILRVWCPPPRYCYHPA